MTEQKNIGTPDVILDESKYRRTRKGKRGNPRPKINTEPLVILIPRNIKDRLVKYCDVSGDSQAHATRKALRMFLINQGF